MVAVWPRVWPRGSLVQVSPASYDYRKKFSSWHPTQDHVKTVNWRSGLVWEWTRPLAVPYTATAQVRHWVPSPWLEGISQCSSRYVPGLVLGIF